MHRVGSFIFVQSSFLGEDRLEFFFILNKLPPSEGKKAAPASTAVACVVIMPNGVVFLFSVFADVFALLGPGCCCDH